MQITMNSAPKVSYSYGIILLSLLLSFALTILPLPDAIANYRPAWVSLCLIYWAVKTPDQVGVGIAWVTGLLLDAFQGTLLGEHALLCTLVVFVAGQMHQRLRLFPLLQQCVFIFLLLGIQFILFMWIQGISGHPIRAWEHGFSVISSTVLWFLIGGMFRSVRL